MASVMTDTEGNSYIPDEYMVPDEGDESEGDCRGYGALEGVP